VGESNVVLYKMSYDRGEEVDHFATSQKVEGSIQDGVTGTYL
jgi:hypothetical protein